MDKEKAICFAGLMESYLNIPSFVCELIEKKLIDGVSGSFYDLRTLLLPTAC